MRNLSITACLVLLLGAAVVTVAGEQFRGLVIAPENRCSWYNPRDYRYPPSVEPRIVDRQGGIFSPYTGEVFASIKDTDIEHIVARSEAHDSGLCSADMATRRAFARDLDNLTLASPGLNRHQKRAKDAAAWLPEKNQCWFAQRVIAVKAEYELTVDEAEVAALRGALQTCAVDLEE